MKEKQSFNIYCALFLSTFFDAYALFYIQSFPVTVFTITSIVFFFWRIYKGRFRIVTLTPQNTLLILFFFYLAINFIAFDLKNITSFMQAIYFLILCLLAYRKENKEVFDRYCLLYQRAMTCMSIYGIYQFFGRMAGFPFTDLIIDGHMVTGYNWTNVMYIFGKTVYRSNAIFREPSFFSQMLAISLLLYITTIFKNEYKEKHVWISISLQIVAMATTFSGTGIMMLTIGVAIFAFKMIKNKSFWKKIIPILLISLGIIIYVLLTTPFGSYFLNRANELFVYDRDASSGFVRFRAWLYVVAESWTQNPFLGSGIGTGASYIFKYQQKFYGMTLNGLAKVATELGLVGVSLWCGLVLSFLQRRKNIMISYRYLSICCSIIPLILMQEAFSSNLFWMLVMLLNCQLYNTNKEATSCNAYPSKI